MSDMALRKPAGVSRGAAITRHRGQAEAPVKVLGQTAAVAGISGALLLALKAMVLVAPVVLPHGTGLDSLGRVAPNTAEVAPVANPVDIGTMVNGALAAAAPRVTGLSEHTADHQAPANGGTTVPRQHNNGGSSAGSSHGSTNPSTGNSGGGSSAPSSSAGVVGNLVDTVGATVDGVVPGVGSTLIGATKPVTDTLDSTLKPVTDTLAPVTGTVAGLTKDLPVVGNLTSSLAGSSAPASSSSSVPADASNPNLVGGLLGTATKTLGLGGILGGQ
jgi:hypothetical protein